MRFEHVMMPGSPAAKRSSIQPATASNNGCRSWSFKGWPDRIFSTLVAGCRSSPSLNGQPSRRRNSSATVVLPDPDTPIISSTVLATRFAASVPAVSIALVMDFSLAMFGHARPVQFGMAASMKPAIAAITKPNSIS